MGSDADFSPLGEIEFEAAVDLFRYCEEGRKIASNSGLILAQGAYDIYAALCTVPMPMDGGRRPEARARRVSRHARRASEALHTAQLSLAKLPRAFMSEYQDVLAPRRNGRKPFDVKKGA